MLIMQFLTGVTTASTFTVCFREEPRQMSCTNVSQMTSTLLTDINMNRSATAHAASSIVRCLFAAGAIAAMEPLADSIGLGWCFGIYAIIVMIEIPFIWFLYRQGDRRNEEYRAAQGVTDA